METGAARLQCSASDGRLEISGEIDFSTCATLDRWLSEHGDADRVAVDMQGVTFIDSSGLRILIDHHQKAAADGRGFEVVDPSRVVQRLLEITGLSDVVSVRST